MIWVCEILSPSTAQLDLGPKHQTFTGAACRTIGAREQSPRTMAQTLERIDLCVAQREAHGPGVRAFLEDTRKPSGVAAP